MLGTGLALEEEEVVEDGMRRLRRKRSREQDPYAPHTRTYKYL